MAVPFRSRDDPAGPGVAAYLRILPTHADDTWTGGLLLVNALAEPLELVRIRMHVPKSALCAGDLAAATTARLIGSLLERCRTRPDVLFFDRGDIVPELFDERIDVDIALATLSTADPEASPSWRCPLVDDAAPDASRRSVDGTAKEIVAALSARAVLVEPLIRVADVLRTPFDAEDVR